MIPAVIAVALAVVLVGAAASSRRVDNALLWRGIGFALGTGAVILVLSTLLIGIGLAGKTFIFSTLSLFDALALGLFVGLAIGAFLLLFGSIFVAAGLLLGRGSTWVSTMWLIGPLLVAGAWIAFPSQVDGLLRLLDPARPSDPTYGSGTATLTVARAADAPQTFQLYVTCGHEPLNRRTTIDARDDLDDERHVAAYASLADGGDIEEFGVRIGVWSPPNVNFGANVAGTGPNESGHGSLEPGSAPMKGVISFTAAPFEPPDGEAQPDQTWSGTLSWNCDRPL